MCLSVCVACLYVFVCACVCRCAFVCVYFRVGVCVLIDSVCQCRLVVRTRASHARDRGFDPLH